MDNIIIFFIVIGILFFIITYPYKFRLARKINRVLSFEEITYTENKDKDFSKVQNIDKYLTIEKRVFENSKYINENLNYVVIKNRGLVDDNVPCLILLHGLKDSHRDWLERAKICENYLNLLINKDIKPINIILLDSGCHGMSWYSNFYKSLDCRYEDYITKELIPLLKSEFPTSKFGICGFSMGGYGAFKLGLKHPHFFKVIGSFSGATSIVRMSVNRRVIRLFNFLYIPKFLFKSEDKLQFIRVFSSWGYKILKEDPYTLIKKLDKEEFKSKYFYASVGENDIENHLMLQQWTDTIGRMKKHKYNFIGYLCKGETHTWEYVCRDLKNFLIYFNDKIN